MVHMGQPVCDWRDRGGGGYRGMKEDNVAEPLPHLIHKDTGSSHLLMLAGRAGLSLHSDSQMLATTVLI